MAQSQHRKTGRPPARRGRLGRNQYSRDLPPNGDSCASPSRDRSHDAHGQTISPPQANPGGAGGINGESGRSSRPKYHNPTRTSMNEMKRRVAGILEFVGRMQTDRQSQSSSVGAGETISKANGTTNGISTASVPAPGPGGPGLVNAVEASLATPVHAGKAKNFGSMASGEMMETLTQELMHWQSLYGRYGEK